MRPAGSGLAWSSPILASVPGCGGWGPAPLAHLGVAALAALDVRGKAVLPHTADDSRSGAPDHATGGYFLTRAGAAWLAGQHPALAGIDAAGIDDTADGERPARTLLPGAGIPVAGHLTGSGAAAGRWCRVYRGAGPA